MLIGLPLSIYKTFVLEEKFGFNKTTPKTFILDLLKSTALMLVLGGPLLAGIIWFFEFSGDKAWLFCWASVTAFTLTLTFFAPKYILPCFNKLEPLDNEVDEHRLA